MIKKGDLIENPLTGEMMEFLQTAQDTGGTLLQISLTVKPGGSSTLPHIHPLQEERYIIQSGIMRVKIHRKVQRLSEGQYAIIPVGTPHAWWNDGLTPLKALVEYRPALHAQDILAAFCALARDGKTDHQGAPNLLRIAVMSRLYGPEFLLASLPIAVQLLLFKSIAPIGLRRGYAADFPISWMTEQSKLGARIISAPSVGMD